MEDDLELKKVKSEYIYNFVEGWMFGMMMEKKFKLKRLNHNFSFSLMLNLLFVAFLPAFNYVYSKTRKRDFFFIIALKTTHVMFIT